MLRMTGVVVEAKAEATVSMLSASIGLKVKLPTGVVGAVEASRGASSESMADGGEGSMARVGSSATAGKRLGRAEIALQLASGWRHGKPVR
jgi:hypothetical protein